MTQFRKKKHSLNEQLNKKSSHYGRYFSYNLGNQVIEMEIRALAVTLSKLLTIDFELSI